jgi:hypothetical protein
VAPNPRKIKRVLNLLAVVGAIIEASPGLGTLDPALVARLVVLRIQSPALYADIVADPDLLRALELTYQRTINVAQQETFQQHFGQRAKRLLELTTRHRDSQDYLSKLFAGSSFELVADDLPTYLTLLGG